MYDVFQCQDKLLKIYKWSVDLYGKEIWNIETLEKRNIESYEMWRNRKMLNIRWVNKIRNKEALRVGE